MTLTTRAIGDTDVQVTALGFGGGPLGQMGDEISEDEASSLVSAAWESGIRYFDTAPLYGHGLSEKRLGVGLSGYPRNEFVVSCKVGRLLVPATAENRNPTSLDREPFGACYDYSYDGARRSLEASLQRLGLDQIDILLCHDIDVWTHGAAHPSILETAARGILPAMCDLRAAGVVRAIGLGVNEASVCSHVMKHFDVDCFLLAGRFTLLEQEPLDDLLPQCERNQVSVIVGGPYNSGMLAVSHQRDATYDYQPVDQERWERACRLRAVCDAHGVDLKAAALQYPLRHPAVASVIPGVWRLPEVASNKACATATLPATLWQELAAEGLVRRITAKGS
ncbi:MAG: aldo/keto reductase [Planctomycetota bacterium]|nr:aldo/keto reductase [Planctomycetota bacterium]